MSSERKPLIAGNWKMNLNHLEAIALVQKIAFSLNDGDLEAVEAAVLPPFVDIRGVQTLIDGDKLSLTYGAQDVSAHTAGAFTGEVSGSMLAKLGCTYACVGHSERRQHHNENDEVVGKKVRQALNNGMSPILCVGEPLEVREAGDHVAHTVGQLKAAVEGLTEEEMATVVVAYEPVWAIGTGRTATPDDAQEVAAALRGAVSEKFGDDVAAKVRVLYGGSVKGANCASIMEKADVDGALVGGASLDADEFAKIVVGARSTSA
ncbi:triose-phosphate isomerase [Haloglycomyces albus]|uniref:triose-phosphate isomerase n=1 Tax=Haloglycomyces albus TaxID=526067 RepID=UPI0004A3B074|nr:triose-phosphate isomerase [Haloglycomyces albus]